MKIPTVAIHTPLLKMIATYETAKQLVIKLDIPLDHVRRVEDKAVLKSSLFSARIEGNALDETTYEHSQDEQAKREVFNLIDAIRYVKHIPTRTSITTDLIRHLHGLVMKDVSPDAGRLRTEQNAIFDRSGNIRYLPPPPATMRAHLARLITYANTPVEFPILTALMTHLLFERIHPFVDGNGRVGRLLVALTLKSQGETFPLVIPYERYLEQHRDTYCYMLDTGMNDPQNYSMFMLEALVSELGSLYTELTQNIHDTLSYLPPRQEEMCHIIADHPYITIDGIRRRFMGVPVRTLRYDISQLVKKGIVIKIGSTKGACYIKKSNTQQQQTKI